MYSYSNMQKQATNLAKFEPVDNMLINGQTIDSVIDGYQQLSVSGRGIIGRSVNTTDIPQRRGVWVDNIADSERELTIKYRLEAKTSEEMRDKFAKLNAFLRQSDYLEVTFKDEQDFMYQAVFTSAEDIEETALKIISKFTLLVPDGYKKGKEQTSTDGKIKLVNAKQVLPSHIRVRFITNQQKAQIKNVTTGKIISFSGDFLGTNIIKITFNNDSVEVVYGGNEANILSQLELYSSLEDFYLHNNDTITVSGGMELLEIKWRDEKL